MTARPNSDSYDREGNLIVPRHGIRSALSLATLAAASFFLLAYLEDKHWHEQNPGTGASGVPDPLWMKLLWVALPGIPFILSELLLSASNEEWIAAGAGIAAAVSAGSLLFAAAAFLSMFFRFLPDPYWWEEILAILVFVACCGWILFVALRIAAKVRSGVFLAAGVATLILMTWGQHSLQKTEYRLDRENEQRKAQAALDVFKPVVEAEHVLASLAGCLILNGSIHRESGYPQSLNPPPADWSCDRRFTEEAVKEYRLTYTPQAERARGSVTDFHLIAVPITKGVRGRYALMVDSRGVVFSDPMWGISTPHIRAARSEARESEIEQLASNIGRYMQEKGVTRAPIKLDGEIVGTTYGEVPKVGDDGTQLEIRNYVLRYFGPRGGDPLRFALSGQCQSYGQECLRSYFLDYDGVLHATGEPRAATAVDPAALACEASDSECVDVEWPVP
jgi:hypothetical protein